jgi:hypothetical protein
MEKNKETGNYDVEIRFVCPSGNPAADANLEQKLPRREDRATSHTAQRRHGRGVQGREGSDRGVREQSGGCVTVGGRYPADLQSAEQGYPKILGRYLCFGTGQYRRGLRRWSYRDLWKG